MSSSRADSSGVPLRAVVALGLAAGIMARGIAPALPGLTVGIEGAIVWSRRLAALLTLLAATGAVAGVVRLALGIVATPRLPPTLRVTTVPATLLGCLLLLLASFRPLEPAMSLLLGASTAVFALLSARYNARIAVRRAAALALALVGGGGLLHVVARKLSLDASEAASLSVFRVAQSLETVASIVDVAAVVIALVWFARRSPRARIASVAIVLLSLIVAWAALRGSLPGASLASVLANRALDPFTRGPASFLPRLVDYWLDGGALLVAALLLAWRWSSLVDERRVELGSGLATVMGGALASRAALDMPIPALLLSLAALFLTFVGAPTQRARDAKDARSASERPITARGTDIGAADTPTTDIGAARANDRVIGTRDDANDVKNANANDVNDVNAPKSR